ncbi:MAG TPA: MBL fold metallo-hydrolase [Oceanospirillales bacterium]|nr:MBL fold metallo-hydrolase [Oceanospirillales bacterium]
MLNKLNFIKLSGSIIVAMLLSSCQCGIDKKESVEETPASYLAPDSILYKYPQKVADNIYSAIGATAAPTYENSGHNNNLSFIITTDGVVVVNSGASYKLAQAIHAEIKKRTDQKVKYVILENAQGHAMLGSNYWQAQGAKIVAHVDAAAVMKRYAKSSVERMKARQKEKGDLTEATTADITFDDKFELNLGGTIIQALHLGPAHSPGDIVVWLPQQKVVIAGDMAFHQRLLPVTEHTDTAAWIDTWNNKFEKLGAEIVVPGHGVPTNMAEVRKYTRDYLLYVRAEVERILEEDGDLQQAYEMDLSAYEHLDTFSDLAKQNIGRIFRAMEFE